MAIRLWSYDPDKCDGDYCPNDCDLCIKAEIDEEHIPSWLYCSELADALFRSKPKENKND